MMSIDMDTDGKDEIVFAGTNRREYGACLFLLRPDSSLGASPPYIDQQYDLTLVMRGNQLHYVVFPATRLCQLAKKLYPTVNLVQPVDRRDTLNRLALVTFEGDSTQQLYYYLDSRCRVSKVDFEDGFSLAWSQMIGIDVRQTDWMAIADTLARAVKYWTDSGWVTEGQLRAAEL